MLIKKGNILDCVEESIVHQVNCMNVMGSGVARALYMKWPTIKSSYHLLCDRIDSFELLGTVQTIELDDMCVFNAFSQYRCGSDGCCYTDYDAVRSCFYYIKLRMRLMGIETIAIPYLYGCGLGGGDWKIVAGIIDEVFDDKAICYNCGG